MRWTFLLLCGPVMAVLCTGCASIPQSLGPSGIGFGALGTAVSYPAQNTSSTQYQLSSQDFEIMGPVHGEGSSLCVLGMVSAGNSGYAEALDQARKMGADDVMNLRVDTRYFGVLFLFGKVDTIVTGTGVRWKNKAAR
jgi:hypothetical protein